MHSNEDAPTPEISQIQMDELLNVANTAFDMTVNHQNDQKALLEVPRLDRLPYQPPGLLFMTKAPADFPNTVLELRYTDNSFGEDSDETEILYLVSRDVSGNLALQVSDHVSTRETTKLMHEYVDFKESLSENLDYEMVRTASDGYNSELSDSFALEKLQLSASLRGASPEDYKTLRELLEHGILGEIHYEETDEWQQISEELEAPEHTDTRRTLKKILRLQRKK